MYVKIEDVRDMSEVVDQEVMGQYIVCKLSDGTFYCTRSYHSKNYESVNSVPFWPAKNWMVEKFNRLEGKGHGDENAQLEDDRIADLAKVSVEEKVYTPFDFYEPKERFGMEGAFEDPFELRGVSL